MLEHFPRGDEAHFFIEGKAIGRGDQAAFALFGGADRRIHQTAAKTAAAHCLIHDHHIDGGAAISQQRRHCGSDDTAVFERDEAIAD